MFRMPLEAFTEDESFPFYIQYGIHNEPLFAHGHDDYFELVIVLSGKARHIVDGAAYPIEKGDVFVVGPDTEHGYEAPQHFRLCNIMFRKHFINFSDCDIAGSSGFQALFVLEPHCTRHSRFCSNLKLEEQNFQTISAMISKLYLEYYGKPIGWKTMIQSAFLELTVTLSRMYDSDEIVPKTGIVKLAPAVAYIETHFYETISVADLARMSNYSERQFIRLFKEMFQCVPMQYITNVRMQNATELLKTTSLSITAIAERCGYADSNYFSKAFRKYYGVTPKGYRLKSKTD